jgi:PAS domain-containing protein
LFFPLSDWIIEFASLKIPVNITTLIQLHRDHISLWFIDAVPVLIAAFVYYYTKKRNKEALAYEKDLINRKERIDKIASFAHSIGMGDYSKLIDIEDDDDVLAKSLLVMRDNLLSNYLKESKENWIAQGKEIISGILRMHSKIEDLASEVLDHLIHYINAVQGAFYLYNEESGMIVNIATYAYNRKKFIIQEFKKGKGLIGQCAYEMDIIYRTEIPDEYVSISSGIIGDKKPKSILIVPLVTNEKLQGIIEFASMQDEIPELSITFLRELGEIIARTIFNLRINQKTEKLLQEAQLMTEELKRNEEQLKRNAEDMQTTQDELKRTNEKLESKIIEVENGQIRLNSLLENASEIITIYDINLNLTFQSPSVKNILGYSTEEITGGKFYSRLIKKGEYEFRNMFQQLLKNPY